MPREQMDVSQDISLLSDRFLALLTAEDTGVNGRAVFQELVKTIQKVNIEALSPEESQVLLEILWHLEKQCISGYGAGRALQSLQQLLIERWQWLADFIAFETAQGNLSHALGALEVAALVRHYNLYDHSVRDRKQLLRDLYTRYRRFILAGLKDPDTALKAAHLNNLMFSCVGHYTTDTSGKVVSQIISRVQPERKRSCEYARDLVTGLQESERTRRIIRAIAQRFGIEESQISSFVEAWVSGISETNGFCDASEQNLKRILQLERAAPKSTALLNSVFHLANFGKYSKRVLLQQLDSLEYPHAPYILICTSTEDAYNPEVNHWVDDTLDLLPEGYFIRITETGRFDELLRVCNQVGNQFGSPTEIVLSSHGNNERLCWNGNDFIYPRQVRKLLEIFPQANHVVFHACDAGQDSGLAYKSSLLVPTAVFSGGDRIVSHMFMTKRGRDSDSAVLLRPQFTGEDNTSTVTTRSYLHGKHVRL